MTQNIYDIIMYSSSENIILIKILFFYLRTKLQVIHSVQISIKSGVLIWFLMYLVLSVV